MEGITLGTIIFFTAGTLLIAWYTWWMSLREKRYHGIYRFFAFESILAIFMLNWPFWFRDPFSPLQIASWSLLFLSIAPAAMGYYLLHRVGKPEGTFENTSALVKEGIYRYIRHPLYGSLVLLGLGAFLKNVTILTASLVLVNAMALVLTAKTEEREMIGKFGDEYRDYMKETKMFIPYIL